MPMRALFIHENYMGHVTHGRYLKDYLSRDSRFDATILSLPSDMQPQYPARLLKPAVPYLHRYGFDVWTWRQFQFRKLQVRRVLQDVDLSQFELVYMHTQTTASDIHRFPNAKRVVSLDSTWSLAFNDAQFRRTPWFTPALNLERRIFEQSDLILTFTNWAKQSVVRDYAIDPGKVKVVRSGVSVPVEGSVVPKEYPFHIGFVGADFKAKGGQFLLDVHQKYFADSAHLTIVTRDAIAAHHLRNVTVHRPMPWHELVTRVMPTFDLFVLPTQYDCGPYVIIEAMTLGIPVIASGIAAIPELINDGVHGLLIDRGDPLDLRRSLEWAMDNRLRLQDMGSEARQRAMAEFDANKTYPQTLNELARL